MKLMVKAFREFCSNTCLNWNYAPILTFSTTSYNSTVRSFSLKFNNTELFTM